MSEPILQVRDLAVTFPTDEGPVRAVQDVSFDVQPGEVLAVVGESGSGKTVTAMSVMGLHPKNTRIEGSIKLLGDELLGMKPAELRARRGKDVAMIFQDPMTAMNPVFTVGYQIAEAIRIHTSRPARDRHGSGPLNCSMRWVCPNPTAGPVSIRTSSRAGCASGR